MSYPSPGIELFTAPGHAVTSLYLRFDPDDLSTRLQAEIRGRNMSSQSTDQFARYPRPCLALPMTYAREALESPYLSVIPRVAANNRRHLLYQRQRLKHLYNHEIPFK
ncbi:hypothetical protein PENSTE_c001G02488 [Penicillium steckii]|uniref:Uncharacterized protein n=1 Tax=Penicillium steckii TaxID=303698 RepID=A0A1V6TZ54_9EURO|nr:hypothetical protein PENSTE_c001G02488 [Penicillium steckii]